MFAQLEHLVTFSLQFNKLFVVSFNSKQRENHVLALSLPTLAHRDCSDQYIICSTGTYWRSFKLLSLRMDLQRLSAGILSLPNELLLDIFYHLTDDSRLYHLAGLLAPQFLGLASSVTT